jgi:hypothetical protein
MVVPVTVPGKVANISIFGIVLNLLFYFYLRFVSMQYTDFSLVQQWYAAGNEIAE